MGLSSCVRKRDLGRLSTGRVSGILCMPQGTWDHISDFLRPMAVVKSIKKMAKSLVIYKFHVP